MCLLELELFEMFSIDSNLEGVVLGRVFTLYGYNSLSKAGRCKLADPRLFDADVNRILVDLKLLIAVDLNRGRGSLETLRFNYYLSVAIVSSVRSSKGTTDWSNQSLMVGEPTGACCIFVRLVNRTLGDKHVPAWTAWR